MNNTIRICLLAIASCTVTLVAGQKPSSPNTVLFRNATLIDGNGGAPLENTDVLVQGETITSIGPRLKDKNARIVDLSGKVLMPALISAHVHIGTLKGTANKPEFYTRENILAQLKKYSDYGVENILVMGSDRPMLFNSGLRDSSVNGSLPGARIFSAGYGFGVPQGAPPLAFAMDSVFRPAGPDEVPRMIDQLALLRPAVVKIWVDDFNGKYTKMDPAVYDAIILNAHRHQLRVAAHAYYLADARKLVADGIDIIAHSIRDSVMDDALVAEMKARNVAYIPTLSLDEFAFIYARKPEWIDDAFFKNALEPGVYEMITSAAYQSGLKDSPDYQRNLNAFAIALKNLKKLYDAGIFIALGTDSGAMPLRAQGFSEHLELALMVEAGLTPLQAISIATKNAAILLKIGNRFGTIEIGKVADFLILGGNPVGNIRNTRKIEAVYKAGKEVSNGPLANN